MIRKRLRKRRIRQLPNAPKKASEVELLEVEQEMVEQTNAQRARYGLPPLIVDRSLERTARAHAAWMTNRRTLQHTSLSVGENIAMGQPTSGAAVGDWMNSSGHRANILSEQLSADWRGGIPLPRRHDVLVPAVFAVGCSRAF